MGFFSQLRLLIWKNLLHQWRSPWFSLFEIFIPTLLIGATFAILLGLRSHFEKAHDEIYTAWPVTGSAYDYLMPTNFSDPLSFLIDPAILIRNGTPHCQFLNFSEIAQEHYHIGAHLVYSPKTKVTEKIMATIQKRYTMKNIIGGIETLLKFANISLPYVIDSTMNVTGFENETMLVDYMMNSFQHVCGNPLWAGIIFDDALSINGSKIHNITYKIRLSNTARRMKSILGNTYTPWDVRHNFAVEFFSAPVNYADNDGGSPGYWREGFLTLERAVNVAITEFITKRKSISYLFDSIMLGRFPFPHYIDEVMEMGGFFLPVVIMFSFMASIIYIVRSIVDEKENMLKEYMKVMGLSQFAQWCAFFAVNFPKLLLTVGVLTGLLSTVTPRSDWTIMLVFFSLFALNVIFYSFFITTLNKSGSTATLVATMGWMLLYVWYAVFSSYDLERPFPLWSQRLNCLNPCIAMTYGITLLCKYEMQSGGLKWSNAFEPTSPDEAFCFGEALIASGIDTIILIILTWYFEAVYPVGQGVPQKPWFFLLPSYWFPSCSSRKQSKLQKSANDQPEFVKIESEPLREPIVNIVNLEKIYGSSIFKKMFDCRFGNEAETVALDKFSMKMYSGEITALLGHNGAGKSTTFGIVSGIIRPTHGTVYVDGYDIRQSLARIRKITGLCPQHNILFDILTVEEHLKFFCQLKGSKWNKHEARSLLDRLRLNGKENSFSQHLSAGQKRKLSLAIAFIGHSKVVFLDEPTSGMDVASRHETWKMLQAEKLERSILLTTHFMQEADLIADRIAIISRGSLQCYGSGMFLKKEYGNGYNLTVAYSCDDRERDTVVDNTLHVFEKYLGKTISYSIAGKEANFLLGTDRNKFSRLFNALEDCQEQLSIDSYGVSISSMEDVFVRVNEEADQRYLLDVGRKNANDLYDLSSLDQLKNARSRNRVSEIDLYLQQFAAMFIKRAIYFRRKWTLFVTQLLLPIAFFAFMAMTSKIIPGPEKQPTHNISFWPYAKHGNAWVLTSTMPFFGKNMKDRIDETLSHMNGPSNLYVSQAGDLNKHIVNKTIQLGQRGLGLHTPIAFDKFTYYKVPGLPLNLTLLKVLFNNYAYDSPALGISVADSLLLSIYSKKNYTINTINHPLPPISHSNLKDKNLSDGAMFLMSYGVIVSLSVLISAYSQFIIREREYKSKHMQLLAGLHPVIYWLVSFIWDAVWFLLRLFAFIGTLYAVQIDEYTGRFITVAILYFAMALYGWASIPMTYWVSFAFDKAPKGYAMIVLFNVISGMGSSIAVPVVEDTIGKNASYAWSLGLSWFFPTYSIANIYVTVYENELLREVCHTNFDCSNALLKEVTICCGRPEQRIYTENVLTDTGKRGIFWPIIFFAVQGFLYWVLVFLSETSLFASIHKIWNACWSFMDTQIYEKMNVAEDSDVIEEKKKVAGLSPKSKPIIAKNLVKRYGNLIAVQGVSFHVGHNECFGLLGVNGAGKTSVFQILSGENSASGGQAYINGADVKSDWKKAGTHLGYCPQFDAVINEMSGEETLCMFARIRGLPSREIPEKVAAVVKAIGITHYAKWPVKSYSGGTKRRLSLGIALVGLPDVLLLDEPTSGVDPHAKRIIWSILSQVRQLGSALVLTSHSMDEAEALCTQMAVMIYGKFRCYGSCQHIKSRYGRSFTLIVRLKTPNSFDQIKTVIKSTFPTAVIKDSNAVQITFEIARDSSIKWWMLFEKMEEIYSNGLLVDYSLFQASLEEIFLNFTLNLDEYQEIARNGNKSNGKIANGRVHSKDESNWE